MTPGSGRMSTILELTDLTEICQICQKSDKHKKHFVSSKNAQENQPAPATTNNPQYVCNALFLWTRALARKACEQGSAFGVRKGRLTLRACE